MRTKSFYEALLGSLGIPVMFDLPEGGRLYGNFAETVFGVMVPFNEKSATIGNGSMSGFALGSRIAVDEFFARVLLLGGCCEGPPGLRSPEEIG